MSVSVDVDVQVPLPDGRTGGPFRTFEYAALCKSYRITADGRLLEIEEPWDGRREPGDPEVAVEVRLHGVLEFEDAEVRYAAHFTDGRLDAVRVGRASVWDPQRFPEGARPRSVLVFVPLHGETAERPLGRAVPMTAFGLPEPLEGMVWVVGANGLVALGGEPSWEDTCRIDADPFDGVAFLRDPAGAVPDQAMRFVRGELQWTVPVGADRVARPPRVLAEVRPPRPCDARHAGLLAAARVLPSDYVDYGGDVRRWADEEAAYPDCSGGCRFFAALHDPETGVDGADTDWGVCTNPRSPRCGLLTFEHQAGFRCFEPSRGDGGRDQ